MNRRRTDPDFSPARASRTRPSEPRVCAEHTRAMIAAVRDEARRLRWEVYPPGGDVPRVGKPPA